MPLLLLPMEDDVYVLVSLSFLPGENKNVHIIVCRMGPIVLVCCISRTTEKSRTVGLYYYVLRVLTVFWRATRYE